jgi:hypothetical protein
MDLHSGNLRKMQAPERSTEPASVKYCARQRMVQRAAVRTTNTENPKGVVASSKIQFFVHNANRKHSISLRNLHGYNLVSWSQEVKTREI